MMADFLVHVRRCATTPLRWHGADTHPLQKLGQRLRRVRIATNTYVFFHMLRALGLEDYDG